MHQAVAAREDVDERTELGDVDDPTLVDRTDVRRGRVEDELDPAARLSDRGAVLRADRHDADAVAVLHRDVGAGLLLDRVDDLALRPDHLADLVERDLEAHNLRRGLAHVVPRCGDRVVHDVEDLEPGVLGLEQRLREHVGGNAVDLRVELQRGDELGSAGDLEVHVAERVLRTEDVGERDVTAVGVDEAHGDAGDRRPDRDAGIHQRQRRRAHGCHRRGAVGGEHLRDEPERVRELVRRGHHRQQRPLGQETVPDLPSLGAPDPPHLAVGEGRHVVVVHVTLLLVDADRVEKLVHARHAERCHVQHLRLAPLEQAGAVGGRDDPHLGGQRAEVGRATAVDPDALLDDPLADDLLRERPNGRLDLRLPSLEDRPQLEDGVGRRLVGRGVALGLVDDALGLGQRLTRHCADPLEDVLAVVGLGLVGHGLPGPDLLHQFTLEVDRLANPPLGRLEAVGDDLLCHLGGARLVEAPRLLGAAGLDHHDGDVATGHHPAGHDQLEGGGVALLVGRVRDPLTVGREGQPDGADRAVERDAGEHQGGGGRVDGQHVVRVLLVGTEDGADDLGLVSVAVDEAGPQRPVDQPGGQDRLVRWSSLTPEERAGDLSGRVHPLLDVDREREEVDPLTDPLAGVRSCQDDGVADVGDDGALGLLGESPRLERQGLLGPRYGTRDGYGLRHLRTPLVRVTAGPVPSGGGPRQAPGPSPLVAGPRPPPLFGCGPRRTNERRWAARSRLTGEGRAG